MNSMTGFAHKLVEDCFTWDFYRIELLTNSTDYATLIDYLKANELDYEEDIAFGSSIVIFRDLRTDEHSLRATILKHFGGHPYFAMEGNVTLSESALYRFYRQIQEKRLGV